MPLTAASVAHKPNVEARLESGPGTQIQLCERPFYTPAGAERWKYRKEPLQDASDKVGVELEARPRRAF